MKTYLRKKTINGREYFYDMTPYWDSEKKKVRAMEERAKNPGMSKYIESRAKILKERGTRKMSNKPFS